MDGDNLPLESVCATHERHSKLRNERSPAMGALPVPIIVSIRSNPAEYYHVI
jgi:hypothetical protein